MNAKSHAVSIAVGAALALGGFFTFSGLLYDVSPFTRFAKEPFDAGSTSIDATNTIIPGQTASLIRRSLQSTTFRLTCPANVKINETFTINLQHDRQFFTVDEHGNRTDYTVSYPAGKGASLSSSAFNIAPSERIAKESKSLPAHFVWTATPKSEGKHLLVLSISELFYHQESDPADRYYKIRNKLIINGTEEARTDLDSVTVPVSVYTIWGISETTYQLLKWGVGAVIFVVTYPLLLTFLKRKLRWGDSD
ncbi:MAG: hypothetical protein O7B35_04795 [Deltaproteobacteria bacterium]|nr:hypothetical protein [Deltaproteobacteria bacterium]